MLPNRASTFLVFTMALIQYNTAQEENLVHALWCGLQTGERPTACYRYEFCSQVTSQPEEVLKNAKEISFCCQFLDHCDDYIPVSAVKYGLYNPDPRPRFECECDFGFTMCLDNITGPHRKLAQEMGKKYRSRNQSPCFTKLYTVPCLRYYDKENHSYTTNAKHTSFCAMFLYPSMWE